MIEDCECYTDDSEEYKDLVFCEACGSRLIDFHKKKDDFCSKCGKREYTVYKKCPTTTGFNILHVFDMREHTDQVIKRYSR